MKFMGLDIGGANTDCVIIDLTDKQEIKSIKSYKEYLPMWKDNEKLPECLMKLYNNDPEIEVICVSMTAELADSYNTKTEGVLDISKKVIETFPEKIVKFVTFDGLKDYTDILKNPLDAAAANWIGTVNAIKYIKNNCIFMDMGSTTTDIIPLKNRKEIASGHTDTQRLGTGELVYTGMLRTNLATIVHEVPVNNTPTSVSSEIFTISADIHRILGNITEDEYTCDTPDGKNKDIESCKRRLCRLICADLDTLDDNEINNIAQYIYEKQVEQVTHGLIKVVEKTGITSVIICDLGNSKICYNAAQKLGLDIIDIDDYISKKSMSIITAIGAVQMYLEENEKNIPLIHCL
ncbi:hydantoinase/oxoprolinase family protein [Methanosphaera sp.]